MADPSYPQGAPPAYGQPGQPAYGQPVTVVTTAPVAGVALTREIGPPPDTTAGLIVSILVCIFCAWPCGIGAIIYNRKANTMVELGQYSVARDNLKTMWIFVAVSVIIGLCWLGYVLGTYA